MKDIDETHISESEVLHQVIQPSAWCHRGDPCVELMGQLRVLAGIRGRLTAGRYRWLQIAWFGVEPLANLPVLRELGVATRAIAAEFECGYDSHVVSNGIALTVPVARQLRDDLGVYELEITTHDSSLTVLRNIHALACETNLGITLRCSGELRRALMGAGLQRRICFAMSPQAPAWTHQSPMDWATAS